MISENLARCLARISADGYLSQKYIRYSNTCSVLREEFKRDMVHEFGDLHFNEGISNSNTPFVQIQRKHIIAVFLSHLPDFRSSMIYVPLAVQTASRSVKCQYIGAFYDDEGCAALRISTLRSEWKRNITLTSNSMRLLTEVKELLLQFDIGSNKIIRNSAQVRDRSYVLAITGKRNISNFAVHIGFKHPWKAQMLEFMMASYQATSKNVLEFNKLYSELKELRRKRWTAILGSRAQAQYS